MRRDGDEQLRKALWRAAINPAAVYGRSGRPCASSTIAAAESGSDTARPVLRHCEASGDVWFSPAFPAWCMRYSLASGGAGRNGHADGCPVADKALAKYGERPVESTLPAKLLEALASAPTFHAPTIDDVFEAETLDGRLSFGAVSVGWHDDFDYPAVPLAYLWRRYGAERLKWRQTGEGMLSAWVSDRPAEWRALCVGLIAPCKLEWWVNPSSAETDGSTHE